MLFLFSPRTEAKGQETFFLRVYHCFGQYNEFVIRVTEIRSISKESLLRFNFSMENLVRDLARHAEES